MLSKSVVIFCIVFLLSKSPQANCDSNLEQLKSFPQSESRVSSNYGYYFQYPTTPQTYRGRESTIKTKKNDNLPTKGDVGSSDSKTSKQAFVPAFDILDTLPKAMEIAGVGILLVRTVSIGTGLPILYPIFIPLVVLLAVATLFFPPGGVVGHIQSIVNAIHSYI